LRSSQERVEVSDNNSLARSPEPASSLERSLAVTHRIKAGFMGVNGGAAYSADVPFGGYKQSGVGRQNGYAGFDQYVEIKSVAWPVDES